MINVFVGYDPREAVAYHVFCESLITNASQPVRIIPLHLPLLTAYSEEHGDGSNAFIYTRFLVPYLMNYEGWAIYCDGDMVVKGDIADLWVLRDESCAVQVVQHQYESKVSVKYLGAKNENYPRKNWSSVILWNCSHPKHQKLSVDFVAKSSGSYLHRFNWLRDCEIGALPKEWNWLVSEYETNMNAKLLHFTLGTPCFRDFRECSEAGEWFDFLDSSQRGME